MGKTLQEFFDEYLGIDWWEGYPNVYLLAPALVRMEPGDLYPIKPTGHCVFFKEGRCSIYEARPSECKAYYHTHTSKRVERRHKAIAEAWKGEEHLNQLTELLGYEPMAPEYSPWGIW